MIFVYFAFEFYRIFNAITCETFILNYNIEFNLGICIFGVNLHIHVMISQTYIYIYKIFKIFLFDPMV